MFSEWLVLALSVPLVLVPLVLLFGFQGCTTRYADFGVEEPVPPEGLVAIAVNDTEIDLSWTPDLQADAAFQIVRAEEGGAATPVAPAVGTSYNDATNLTEGITYVYQVVASEGPTKSNEASATTFPKSPSNLAATAVSVDQIDLSWTNESANATQFSLQYRLKGAATWDTVPGYNGTDTSFSHTGLAEGTDYEYQVLAVIPVGFQNSVLGPVFSKPSAIAAKTWTLAFSASLTDPQALEGFCLIQRISAAQFVPFPTQLSPTMVRLTLASSGLLTLNRIYLSQVAPSGDPWDAGADLTKVVDVSQGDPPAVLQGNSSLVLGPVSYALDRTQDLLVAFDIDATAGLGNVISVAQSGATHYFKAASQEASVSDRPHFTTGHDLNYLIERIEVL